MTRPLKTLLIESIKINQDFLKEYPTSKVAKNNIKLYTESLNKLR